MLRKVWRRLVEHGFYLLYNEMAWSYDLVSWVVSLGEWRAWQRAALPFVAGERVLEIAHGPGHMLLALARSGYHVVGLDLSPHMGRQARRRLSRAGFSLRLVRGTAQALPFAGGSFDTVVSTFPTAFILEPATIAAVYRVLQPGGRLVVVPEGHLTGQGPLQRLINWLYVITGQREGAFAVDAEASWPAADAPVWQAYQARMARQGFRLALERQRRPRSLATVLIAAKPPLKESG
ncbi:MAG: class I SAM-dependent methyltransferase [Candidatus Promineifilaceae bacterium]|nr:class I SAM-dependent methyltransferase [Candidatus Promineifilaceae bacterium]